MTSTLPPTTGTGPKNLLVAIVTQLLIFTAILAQFGVLIVVAGIVLLVSAAIGIIFLLFTSLLLGSLFLVLKGCNLFVLQIGKNRTTPAFAFSSSPLKPRLIAALKRFIRWMIPLLLWHLWQWSTSPNGASRAQSQHQPFLSG